MQELIAKMGKFKDVKEKAVEMFKKGEIGAIRTINIEHYRENNYCAIYFFPDIEREYNNEKILKRIYLNSRYILFPVLNLKFGNKP